MNEELKQQAHKKFDEKFCDFFYPDHYGLKFKNGEDVYSEDIKSFIDSLIDNTVQATEAMFMQKILKNVDMTDEQLQDILSLTTNK